MSLFTFNIRDGDSTRVCVEGLGDDESPGGHLVNLRRQLKRNGQWEDDAVIPWLDMDTIETLIKRLEMAKQIIDNDEQD